MRDGLIDDVIPDLGAQQSASEPALAAGTINRISGTGDAVQVWAIIDGFDGYEWGPLEHRPFAPGETPVVGARCAIGIFSDEKWLVGLDETAVTAATWYTGTTAPAAGLGDEGDLYLDTTANAWYGPKHAGAWGTSHPLTRVPAFLVGTGAPGGGTGVDGDSYLDLATGLVYSPKASGAWPAPTALPNSVQIGSTQNWGGPARSIPAKWLACFGQSLLRATYPTLFAALCPVVSTVTVTLASPGVWTTPAPHGLVIGDPVTLTTTGALPTGLTAGLTYYVMTVPTSSTFTLGTTRTIVAATGIATVTTAVNTSVSQSGVHTLLQTPHGTADLTHFNAPDLRGRTAIGKDTMGGAAASTLLWTPVDGLRAGESLHQLISTESGMPGHQHGMHQYSAVGTGNATPPAAPGTDFGINAFTEVTGPADASVAHNNVPAGMLVEKIIYAGV